MDAFISHSSVNAAFSRELERALENQGLDVWLDSSDMPNALMLRRTLREAIRDAHALVLLWSEAASKSRWVNSEWITAVLMDRPILPCSLDATGLPECLGGAAFAPRVDAAPLARSIRAASGTTVKLTPLVRHESGDLSAAISELAQLQMAVVEATDKASQAAAQREADAAMKRALARWPQDLMVANLAAYHLKNAYMTDHWDDLMAGVAPADERLERAERLFFDALWADPHDPSAINGLGTVLAFEHEPEAAEFFILAAIRMAEERGLGSYPAAEHDLELARRVIRADQAAPAGARSGGGRD